MKSLECRNFANRKLKQNDMKKNVIEKIMAKHSSLNEFVDGMAFLKEVHSLYKVLGGMNNYQIAKGILRYITKENELEWDYVVRFIFYLLEEIDKKGISESKKNIDWERACKKYYSDELSKIKTKVAFKELFYLVALNNNDDIDDLLAEPILEAYGWYQIVKKTVAQYEEILSTNTEYAEHMLEEKEMECDTLDVHKEKNNIQEESQKNICTSTTPKVDGEENVHSEENSDFIAPKKYVRGRPIVLKCLTDGKEMEWTTAKAIEDSLGIPKGAIRKNVSGHSKYIRHNNIKYQAFYKEVC